MIDSDTLARSKLEIFVAKGIIQRAEPESHTAKFHDRLWGKTGSGLQKTTTTRSSAKQLSDNRVPGQCLVFDLDNPEVMGMQTALVRQEYFDFTEAFGYALQHPQERGDAVYGPISFSSLKDTPVPADAEHQYHNPFMNFDFSHRGSDNFSFNCPKPIAVYLTGDSGLGT